MMTAHVVFAAIDDSAPASTSGRIHSEIIRGEIDFGGLLFSDDLSMSALSGEIGLRAAAVIQAGSDIALHCNGDLGEMEAVAANVPEVAGQCAERFADACKVIKPQPSFDAGAAQDALEAVRRFADESLD